MDCKCSHHLYIYEYIQDADIHAVLHMFIYKMLINFTGRNTALVRASFINVYDMFFQGEKGDRGLRVSI